MNDLITDIELDDDTFDLIERVAKIGEHPLALVQAADLHPGEFAQFLQETGRSTDPAGLLLLGLSAGRSLSRPSGAEVRAAALDLFAGGAFVGGIFAGYKAVRRRRWLWAGFSILSIFASIPLRMLSRRFSPQAVHPAPLPLRDAFDETISSVSLSRDEPSRMGNGGSEVDLMYSRLGRSEEAAPQPSAAASYVELAVGP